MNDYINLIKKRTKPFLRGFISLGNVLRVSFPSNNKSKPPFWDKDTSDFPAPDLINIIDILVNGHDLKSGNAKFVTFDFDFKTESEHTGSGLEADCLDSVIEALKKEPTSLIYRSKSGKGIHAIIKLAPDTPCISDREYRAISKFVLQEVSKNVNFDLSEHVDCCGSLLCISSVDAMEEGFRVIQEPSQEYFTLPEDYKDLLEITNKVSIKDVVPLEPEHQRIIDYLKSLKYDFIEDDINHCFKIHTCALQIAHKELKLKGVFKTSSGGTSPSPNGFMYPNQDGSFLVKRYGGAKEEFWAKDYAWLNNLMTIDEAGEACNGQVNGNKIMFSNHLDALETLQAVGHFFNLKEVSKRKAELIRREGIIQLRIAGGEHEVPDGFSHSKGYWEKSLKYDGYSISEEYFRVGIVKGKYLYYYKSELEWARVSLSDLRSFLKGDGFKLKDIEVSISQRVKKAYGIVGLPFKSEFIEGNKWNKDGVQFKVEPSSEGCEDLLENWSKIFSHLGKKLDVTQNSWCMENGVDSGDKYLRCWLASLVQYPEEPLPVLFFYGSQNSGKSTFHLSINRCLFDVVSVNHALTTNFNDELFGNVLGYVEEIDLSKDRRAANNLKIWSTNESIGYHFKGIPAFSGINTMHFIQVANDVTYAAPIDKDDTRYTFIEVPPLEDEIPQREFKELLQKEAPSALRFLLDLEIPHHKGRFRIPFLDSEQKKAFTESISEDVILDYVDEYYDLVDEGQVEFKNFYEHFMDLGDEIIPKRKFSTLCKLKLNMGNGTGNKLFIFGIRRKEA